MGSAIAREREAGAAALKELASKWLGWLGIPGSHWKTANILRHLRTPKLKNHLEQNMIIHDICLSHVRVLHNLHILAFSRRSASCHNDKVLRHVDMQLLMMFTEPSSCWTVHSPFVSKRPCWRLASECACSHPSMWFWVVISFLNVCKSKLWSNCYMFYSWWLNHTYGIRLECCCTARLLFWSSPIKLGPFQGPTAADTVEAAFSRR